MITGLCLGPYALYETAQYENALNQAMETIEIGRPWVTLSLHRFTSAHGPCPCRTFIKHLLQGARFWTPDLFFLVPHHARNQKAGRCWVLALGMAPATPSAPFFFAATMHSAFWLRKTLKDQGWPWWPEA